RVEAVRGATRRTAPIVFTAGLIVAAGTGALVVGKLGFFRAFGPGLALTTLIALVVSATLVPALLGLFGARLFGGTLEPPDTGREIPEQPRHRLLTGLWRMRVLAGRTQTRTWRLVIARIAAARPVALPIAVACIAGLAVLATGLNSTRLGLGFV